MVNRNDIYNYIMKLLSGRDLATVDIERMGMNAKNFFSKDGYTDTDIEKIKLFTEELIDNLGKLGLNHLSIDELKDFFEYGIDTNYEDQSRNYTEGIIRGGITYRKVKQPEFTNNDDNNGDYMYEDDEIKIQHKGDLMFDESEYVGNYKVIFLGDRRSRQPVDCYTNIDSILLADNEEYRDAVKHKLLHMINIRRSNCSHYIGDIVPTKKDGKTDYELRYDKATTTAVMDYAREQEGER